MSTLLTGAALATGSAVYASFNTSTANVSPPVYASLAAPAAGQTVVSVRYLLARRARAARRGVQQTSPRLLPVLHLDDVAVLGVGVLRLGWVRLVWRQIFAQCRFALAGAVTFGLIGARLVVAGDTGDQNYLGYALTAIVAAVSSRRTRGSTSGSCWPAGASVPTLVVPAFLYDVTGGSLGASGVMLVAGVTLLAGSLAGLRILNTADADQLPAAH